VPFDTSLLPTTTAQQTKAIQTALPLVNSREGRDLARSLTASRDLARSLADTPAGRDLVRYLATSREGRDLARSLATTPAGRDLVQSLTATPAGRDLARSLTASPEGRTLARSLADTPAGRDLVRSLADTQEGLDLVRSLAASREGRTLARSQAASPEGRTLARSLAASPEGRRLVQYLADSPAGRTLARSLTATPEGRNLVLSLTDGPAGRNLVRSLTASPEGYDLTQSLTDTPEGRNLARSLADTPAGRNLVGVDTDVGAAFLFLLAGGLMGAVGASTGAIAAGALFVAGVATQTDDETVEESDESEVVGVPVDPLVGGAALEFKSQVEVLVRQAGIILEQGLPDDMARRDRLEVNVKWLDLMVIRQADLEAGVEMASAAPIFFAVAAEVARNAPPSKNANADSLLDSTLNAVTEHGYNSPAFLESIAAAISKAADNKITPTQAKRSLIAAGASMSVSVLIADIGLKALVTAGGIGVAVLVTLLAVARLMWEEPEK